MSINTINTKVCMKSFYDKNDSPDTTSRAGSVSESPTYVKRDELKKYVPESQLKNWLERTGYIPVAEIKTLIDGSKSVILETLSGEIGKNTTETDLDDIRSSLTKIKEYIDDFETFKDSVSASIDESIKSIDLEPIRSSISELESQSASYLKTGEFNEEMSKIRTEVSGTYAKKTDIRKYLTKAEASAYLRIEDYRGLKDATTINNTYVNSTIEDFKKRINENPSLFQNGFYMVNHQDVIILKDGKIFSTIIGGSGMTGADGKSAYEIAKEINPEIGSEAEWINSLKGERGETGPQGPPGTPENRKWIRFTSKKEGI